MITGSQIKALREKLGWNQVQLARELLVHPMTVSRWERGIMHLQPGNYERMRALMERNKDESR